MLKYLASVSENTNFRFLLLDVIINCITRVEIESNIENILIILLNILK